MHRLLEIGFQPVGYWFLENQSLQYQLNFALDENILYCFISHSHVQYIGATLQSLGCQLERYKAAQRPARFSRVNGSITAELEAGRTVEILALKDQGLIMYGGFRVNLPMGLKQSLINEFRPGWNQSLRNTPFVNAILFEEGYYDPVHPDEELNNFGFVPSPSLVEFSIPVNEAYFSEGYIDIPGLYNHFFGPDMTTLQIMFEGYTHTGFINNHFDGPDHKRIVIGYQLTRFICDTFGIGEVINVRVHSLFSIDLF